MGAGTPTQEIEDFLAGGRENPNPYLYEAAMIRRKLELMTLSQMKNMENVEAAELERCQVHGVMAEKGKCCECLVVKLEKEMSEEAMMRRRVRSSWLDLDD